MRTPQLGGLGGGQGIRSGVRSGSDLAVVGLDKTIPLDPVPTDRVGADAPTKRLRPSGQRFRVAALPPRLMDSDAAGLREFLGGRPVPRESHGDRLDKRFDPQQQVVVPVPPVPLDTPRPPLRFIRLLLSARVRASLAEAHTKAAGGTSVQTGYFFHDFGAKRFPSGPGISSRARAETSRRVGKKVPEIRSEKCQELPVRRDLPNTSRTNRRIRASGPVRRFSRSHCLLGRGHDPKGGSPEPRS